MSAKLAQRVAGYLAFAVCVWFCHTALQQQYQRHCRSNLLRVVLFGNSSLCVHMQAVLTQVEAASSALLPSLLTTVLQPWIAAVYGGVCRLVGITT